MLRLKMLRKKENLTQREIAEKLGVSQATYSRWENEQLQMDYAALLQISDFFNVTADYLLGRSPKKSNTPTGAVSIPVYGDVGLVKNKLFLELTGYTYISKKFAGEHKYFGIEVTDDGFAPRILKGDTVIVRRQSKCKSGDTVVLITADKMLTVKRIFKHKYGIILTEPCSEPTFLSRDDIVTGPVRIIGKVVGLIGKI